MPYAVDQHGCPLLFISSLAMHTQNIREDRHVSLLISHTEANVDPLASTRVTLLGLAEQVPAAEVSGIYLARHENARQWHGFSDFSYYRIDVAAAYFIGGFGVMGWISSEDYNSACPVI